MMARARRRVAWYELAGAGADAEERGAEVELGGLDDMMVSALVDDAHGSP